MRRTISRSFATELTEEQLSRVYGGSSTPQDDCTTVADDQVDTTPNRDDPTDPGCDGRLEAY